MVTVQQKQDIPKIADKEFSVTLNAFFVVRWKDERLVIDQDKMEKNLGPDDDIDAWIPVDVSFIKEFWLPDAEILNLKEFETLNVLSKLEGLWLNRNFEIMYAVATRITFICPMTFNSFPLDVQVCLFQVKSGSAFQVISLQLYNFFGKRNKFILVLLQCSICTLFPIKEGFKYNNKLNSLAPQNKNLRR